MEANRKLEEGSRVIHEQRLAHCGARLRSASSEPEARRLMRRNNKDHVYV